MTQFDAVHVTHAMKVAEEADTASLTERFRAVASITRSILNYDVEEVGAHFSKAALNTGLIKILHTVDHSQRYDKIFNAIRSDLVARFIKKIDQPDSLGHMITYWPRLSDSQRMRACDRFVQSVEQEFRHHLPVPMGGFVALPKRVPPLNEVDAVTGRTLTYNLDVTSTVKPGIFGKYGFQVNTHEASSFDDAYTVLSEIYRQCIFLADCELKEQQQGSHAAVVLEHDIKLAKEQYSFRAYVPSRMEEAFNEQHTIRFARKHADLLKQDLVDFMEDNAPLITPHPPGFIGKLLYSLAHK